MSDRTESRLTARSQWTGRWTACWTSLLWASVVILGMGQSAFAQTSQTVRITAKSTTAMSGTKQVGTVNRDEQYPVLDSNKDWIKIEFSVGGKKTAGWVKREDVELSASESGGSKDPLQPAPVTPTPAPQSPTYARVVVDRAPVKSGQETIAGFDRDSIVKVMEEKGSWLRVAIESEEFPSGGWVESRLVERLPFYRVGNRRGGDIPVRIIDVTPSVDWSTSTTTIEFDSVGLGGDSLSFAGPAERVAVERTQSGKRLMSRLSLSQLRGMLASQTRSFWLQSDPETSKRTRVDLNAITLGEVIEVQKFDSIKDGVIVAIPVKFILPGYVAEYSVSIDGSARQGFRSIAYGGTSLPRIGDVYRKSPKDPEVLRIILPKSEGGANTSYWIRVRNTDGSISPVLAIERKKDDIAKKAIVVQSAKPAPLDVAIDVPDVELLDGATAARTLSESGLESRFLEFTTWAHLSAEKASSRRVLKQGVRAGKTARAGEVIVLAVDGNARPFGPNDGPNDAAIDVDDHFGFIDLIGSSNALSTPDSDALQANVDSDSFISSGTPKGSDPGAPIDDSNLSAQLNSDSNSNRPSTGYSVVPLPSDIGLSLEPAGMEKDIKKRMLLKFLFTAIFSQRSAQNVPGPVGATLTECLNKYEAGLRQPPMKAVPADAMVGMLEILKRHLRIEVPKAIEADMANDWNVHVRTRPDPRSLDENRNGVICDDVVVWIAIHLCEDSILDPATLLLMTSDAGGRPVAILAGTPQIGGWNAGLASAASGAKPAAPARAESSIPIGEQIVKSSYGPDQVRVPKLRESTVAEGTSRLKGLGLRIADSQRLFSNDQIDENTPRSREWVPSGTAVRVSVLRQIPDLVGKKVTQARDQLAQFGFGADVGDTVATDIVLRQDPVARAYRAPDSRVTLTPAAIVPDVVRKQHDAATENLKEYGLAWESDTKAFRNDEVVNQRPGPGAIVEHGTSVNLTVHLRVPDLLNSSLDNARRTLENWDLDIEVPNSSALGGDRVAGQRPAARTLVPHRSSVSVGPVYGKVPDVRGRSIASAKVFLTDEENFKWRAYNVSQDEDRVMAQNPAAGVEIERGAEIFLDIRTRMPNYLGMNVLAIREAVNSIPIPITWKLPEPAAQSDIVVSQDPNPGTMIFPRAELVFTAGLKIPDVTGRSLDEANRVFKDLGLRFMYSAIDDETLNPSLLQKGMVITAQSIRPGTYARANIGEINLNAVQYRRAVREVPDFVDRRVVDVVKALNENNMGLNFIVVGADRNTDDVRGRGYTARQSHTIREAYAATLAYKPKSSADAERENDRRIFSQDPPAGTTVDVGTTVKLIVELRY